MTQIKPIEVLLVDDDEADIELTKRALLQNKIKINLSVCNDGVSAMRFLNRVDEYANSPRPDMVFLDLNMPKKDGRETLEEIRASDDLKDIPVVVLTTSESDEDVIHTYKLGCNCYVSKPVDLNEFTKILKVLKDFWFTIVKLPNHS